MRRDRLAFSVSLWWVTVAYGIPFHALAGTHLGRDGGIVPPCAKSRPMCPKLIGINHLSEDSKICFPINESSYFVIGKRSRFTPAIQQPKWCGDALGGEYECGTEPTMLSDHPKTWRGIVRNQFHICVQRNVKGRTFANICDCYSGFPNRSGSQRRIGISQLKPRALISREIMLQVAPLNNRYCCIDYTSYKPYSFEAVFLEEYPLGLTPDFSSKRPPWVALICGCLGVTGICWGWRNDKRRPWSVVALVGGIGLWFYACLILLPWSAQF